MDKFDKLIDLIDESNSVIIGVHSNPDGDTIGSALSLYYILQKLGKDVDLYSYNSIPFNLKFLPESDKFSNKIRDINYDLLLIVDVGTFERVSDEFSSKVKYKNSAVIDHHVTVSDCCQLKYIDSTAASTGIILYKFIKLWKPELLDKNVAVALYTSIVTDTGSFGFANSSSEAFKIAGELVDAGVKPSFVSQNVFSNQPLEKMKLLARVLSTLTISPNGRWAYIIVTDEMLVSIGAKPDLVEGMINYPRSIDTVKIALQFKEIDENNYKVSLRSKGNIDIEVLCRELGGGGHKNAAACKISGTLDDVIELMTKKVDKILKR